MRSLGAGATPTRRLTPGPTPAPTPTAVRTVRTAVGPGVSPTDPEIEAAAVQFPGQSVTLMGYVARPKAGTPAPCVLVCHANRGINAHIQDITRRLAKAGFTTLAVDLLSREGGTEKLEPTTISRTIAAMPMDTIVGDFQAGYKYLQGLSNVRGDRLGMTGFCLGGGVTWRVALRTPELRAAVPFYGSIPGDDILAAEAPNLKAAVLGFNGGTDTFVNPRIPAGELAMRQNGKTFEKVIYDGAAHGFNEDNEPARYHAAAAKDAWEKTHDWFVKYLMS
ncbi:MAG: dienelactone hydrolase family protein [Dehalococcoidia bacterium]|nr:dienelactone hydrolase family protein [Dehalococcoidia bacterium]